LYQITENGDFIAPPKQVSDFFTPGEIPPSDAPLLPGPPTYLLTFSMEHSPS